VRGRSEAAIYALVGDAKDEQAQSSICAHGFVPFGDTPGTLILSSGQRGREPASGNQSPGPHYICSPHISSTSMASRQPCAVLLVDTPGTSSMGFRTSGP